MIAAPAEKGAPHPVSTAWWPVALVAAGAFAIALSPWAAHGDLFTIAWVAHHALDGHLNVYEAVLRGPARELIGTLTYPPLTYLLFAAIMVLGRPFGLFQRPDWAFPLPLTPAEWVFIRAAFAAFVFLIGWTAYRFTRDFIATGDEASARRTFLVAVTSPVLLFVAFVFGQFDVIPAALLFLGVYLLASGRLFSGVMAVFGGIWLKNFPALFLVVAFPLLWAEYGFRRVVVAVVVGIAATAGILLLFAGPGLSASYLAFQHAEYDVAFSYAGGWMDIRLTLANVLLLALLLASVGLAAFRNQLQLWERLLLVYVVSLAFLLAPRFWMPQYMAWLAPGLVLFPVLTAPLESPLSPLLYLGWNAAYLLATFLLHPVNVDTVMFRWLYHPGVPPLAARLHVAGARSEIWTAMFVLTLLLAAILALRLTWRDALARLQPVRAMAGPSQFRYVVWGSTALMAGFIVLHLSNVWLARR